MFLQIDRGADAERHGHHQADEQQEERADDCALEAGQLRKAAVGIGEQTPVEFGADAPGLIERLIHLDLPVAQRTPAGVDGGIYHALIELLVRVGHRHPHIEPLGNGGAGRGDRILDVVLRTVAEDRGDLAALLAALGRRKERQNRLVGSRAGAFFRGLLDTGKRR